MATPFPTFVAVGHDGIRLLSADGVTWNIAASGKEGEVYRAVAFANGRCVAVGTFGGKNVMTSTADGKTWAAGSHDGKYRYRLLGVATGQPGGAETFVGIGGDPGSVGSSSPFVLLSTDGVKWSDQITIPGRHIIRRLAWGNGKFVGVGDRGRRATSVDAKDWKDSPGARAAHTLIDVCFGGPAGKMLFVGVGMHGLRMTSEDGMTWSAPLPGEEGEHLNSVLWTGTQFVAVGAGATYLSPDGKAWTRKPNTNAPQVAAYGVPEGGKGLFVGTAWRGRILTSADAVEWKDVHRAASPIEAVGFGVLAGSV